MTWEDLVKTRNDLVIYKNKEYDEENWKKMKKIRANKIRRKKGLRRLNYK